MSVATTKTIIDLIRKNENGRFIYRGDTTAQVAGYPTDTTFEIWDDTRDQKTYHIPKLTAQLEMENLSRRVFDRFFCDENGHQYSGHPDELCVRREDVIEQFPETAEWPITGEHGDRFGYVLGNGVYLFPDFEFKSPAFTAI